MAQMMLFKKLLAFRVQGCPESIFIGVLGNIFFTFCSL